MRMKRSETIFGKNREATRMLQHLPIRDRAATIKEIEDWGGYAFLTSATLDKAAQILLDAGLQQSSRQGLTDRLVIESRDSTHILLHICFRIAQGEFLLVKRKIRLLMRSLLLTGEKLGELSRRLGYEYPGGEVYDLFWDSYMDWSGVVAEMLQDKHDLDWEQAPLKMHDWTHGAGEGSFPMAHPQVEEVKKRISTLCRLLQKYEAEP
jgi:hypothetical protein